MKKLEGQDALNRVHQLMAEPKPSGPYSNKFITWRINCLRVISKIESEQSSTYKAFNEIDFEGNSFGIPCVFEGAGECTPARLLENNVQRRSGLGMETH
jgi:hypothetical protein